MLGKTKDLRKGLVVFRVPVGHHVFVQQWLADKGGSHLQLLSRIPTVQDAAWLTDSPQFAPVELVQLFFRERGLHPDRFRGSIGRPGQIVCRRSMPVDSRCAHSFSKSWKDFWSTVCSGSPTRCRRALATEGMELPELSKFSDPHFRAPQPVDPEVGEWTHGAGISTWAMRFYTFHQPLHQIEDHLHSRRTARRFFFFRTVGPLARNLCGSHLSAC